MHTVQQRRVVRTVELTRLFHHLYVFCGYLQWYWAISIL